MEAIERMVSEMCELQKHGGPDDAGLYSCPATKLVLGHRRLALIDLSAAGHQPMFYEGRYVISFNGEIYNYRELKAELGSLGLQFHTHCDTEVILAAFSQWNTQSFARLSGMYAFALYDTFEQELYLVRDPAGIKPLYYCSGSTSIEFASEIRAFRATGDKKAHKDWPIYQLAYGHLPEPVTTLQEVQPLHKGCFYKYNISTGADSLQSFTHYSYSERYKGGDISEAIRQCVSGAVGRHLLADAPIGVFLSGGIDSSIITLLASAYQQEHLKTLSIYFREPQFSERGYQDQLIAALHCKYYQHLLTEDEFQASFPAILEAMDMPSCDGINTWFISKYAKMNGLKAVLSGIGGDELFGGYPSFNRMAMAKQLQLVPSILLGAARNRSAKELNRLPYLSIDGIKGLYLYLRGLHTPLQIARQLDSTEAEVWAVLGGTPVLPKLSSLSAKNEASWMEFHLYMQNQLLRDADVMSMAHGIEIRVPFLDPEVISSAFSFNSKTKYAGGIPKYALIHAFRDQLPEPIWKRKKMGFSFPFTEWLGNSTYVADLMASASQPFRHAYTKFKEGKLHWSHLMSLIILQSRGVGKT